MTRRSIAFLVVLGTIAVTSMALGQSDDRPRPDNPEEALAARRQNAEQRQLMQKVRQQIAEMKGDHETLVAQLRAIHAAALKEKATETADKVERLIAKQQETFQTRMGQLQQHQQRIQRAARERMVRPERPQRRGRRAPDFELKSFDGQTVSLAQYKGRAVVLEWFNMECPFSKYHYETKPTMVDLARKYKDKEVVWLAVNSTNHTTPEVNLAFAKKHKLPFPILDDRSGRVGRAYGARTTPHIIIVDKDGVIAYNGAIDSAPLGKVKEGVEAVNYVDQALAQLTAGQKVSTPATPPYGCSVKYARR
jgi:peroxiredoxin